MFRAIFGRRDSDTVPVSPLLAQSQRQIESIKACFPNVVEVNSSLYTLGVNVGGVSLTIEINLPPGFPHEAPILKVSPPVTHPLVDESQQISGVTSLTAFSMHDDLGAIIQRIVAEFQRNPPKLLTEISASAPFSGANLSTTDSIYRNTTASKSYQPLMSPFQNNKRLSQFPQLCKFSSQTLQELLNDERKLNDFVEQLPEVLRTEEIKREMRRQNENLAKQNLEKKPVMEEYKNNLLHKVDEINRVRKEFDESSETFDLLAKVYHPSALQDNLQVAALAAEEDSDAVAESFLEGKLSTEAFLSQFMEKRILNHQRRAKEEKLQHQLHELQKAGF